eukprot:gb/GECG01011185.1/.p1 GENE.gb/GECG01011185.1/~~gb/GECG01011185.1/.p1  ORF type:complete len:123 (+),score=4.72 gb/GECG01011185.1/:1-369(+)
MPYHTVHIWAATKREREKKKKTQGCVVRIWDRAYHKLQCMPAIRVVFSHSYKQAYITCTPWGPCSVFSVSVSASVNGDSWYTLQVEDGTSTGVMGITDHAQQQLGDIVFIDLPEKDQELESG